MKLTRLINAKIWNKQETFICKFGFVLSREQLCLIYRVEVTIVLVIYFFSQIVAVYVLKRFKCCVVTTVLVSSRGLILICACCRWIVFLVLLDTIWQDMHEPGDKFSGYDCIFGLEIVGCVFDPLVLDQGVVGTRVEKDGLALDAVCWVAFSEVVLARPALSGARAITRVNSRTIDLGVEHGEEIGCEITSTGEAAERE